jgi:predicted lactoylglutathione lyase
MKINQIYVNLPVKNIQKTKEFWTNLGFSVNNRFPMTELFVSS